MKKGQSTLEYIYLIAVAAMALAAMLVYVGRGLQGHTRNQADQIGAGQYEPGATVINTETKTVESNITSSSENQVTAGYKGDIIYYQKALNDNLNGWNDNNGHQLGQKELQKSLAVLYDKLKWKGLAEAKAKADRYSIVQSFVDMLTGLGNWIASGLGLGPKPADPSDDKWSTVEDNIRANQTQAQTLKLQLETAQAQAKQYPNDPYYQEQVTIIQDQLNTKAEELSALNDTRNLMILTENNLPDAYKLEKTALINEYGNGNQQKAIDAIEALMKKKQDDINQTLKDKGGATPDYDPATQAANQSILDSFYNAITNIKPPPATPFNSSIDVPETIEQLQAKIAETEAELARRIDAYTILLNKFNALTIYPNQTSSRNTNFESGTITTIKTTDETLGNL